MKPPASAGTDEETHRIKFTTNHSYFHAIGNVKPRAHTGDRATHSCSYSIFTQCPNVQVLPRPALAYVGKLLEASDGDATSLVTPVTASTGGRGTGRPWAEGLWDPRGGAARGIIPWAGG